MKKILTLTEKHVETARDLFRPDDDDLFGKPISRCCPIFQCLSESFPGLIEVAFDDAGQMHEGQVRTLYLDHLAGKITRMAASDWELIKTPMKFIVEIPD